MKRISAIGVLLILFLNFAGFYIYFSVQLISVKKAMRKELESKPVEELVVLKLSRQEYKEALVEEHEVSLDGKMFDIARQVADGEEIILYGLYDDEETDLVAWLDELLCLPLYDKTAFPGVVLQFITLSYLPSHCEIVFLRSSSDVFITPYQDICSSFLPFTEVPPPRLLVSHCIT